MGKNILTVVFLCCFCGLLFSQEYKQRPAQFLQSKGGASSNSRDKKILPGLFNLAVVKSFQGTHNEINAQKNFDSLIIIYADGIKEKYNYLYDKNGIMSEWFVSYQSLGKWNLAWRTVDTYNTDGSVASICDYAFNINNWDTASRQLFTYETEPMKSSYLFQTYSSGKWSDAFIMQDSYNRLGEIDTSLQIDWTGAEWVNDYRVVYNISRSSSLIENWQNDIWVPQYIRLYQYDSLNNCISGLVDSLNNGAWTPYLQYFFSYNAANQPTELLVWVMGSGKWVNYMRSLNFYNPAGFLLKTTFEWWNGSNWFSGDGDIRILNPDNQQLGVVAASVDYYYGTAADEIKSYKNSKKDFFLNGNFPNPFNPSTTITYAIPDQGFVTVKVFDILGNLRAVLVEEHQTAGNHSVQFIGSNYSSGVYICSVSYNNQYKTKGMILLK